jgi:hypothetical protein
VKYRPDDAELLAAIAVLLEEEVMPAVPPALQHQVRVAANLVRILERQQALQPPAAERERGLLSNLLGRDGEARQLRAQLDHRISQGDPSLDDHEVWEALVAIARDDVAVAKPGYDSWPGE